MAKQKRDTESRKAVEEAEEKEAEENRRDEAKARVRVVLGSITAARYNTLYGFLADLMTTKDQQQSAQVSKMLLSHGVELLDHIERRQPKTINHWITQRVGDMLAIEGQKLVEYLRPAQGQEITEVLRNFSLERILMKAECIVPMLCGALRNVGRNDGVDLVEGKSRKDKDLVSALCCTVLIPA